MFPRTDSQGLLSQPFTVLMGIICTTSSDSYRYQDRGGGTEGNSINTHILYYPSDLKYHYLGTLVGVIYEPPIKWRMGASKPLKVPTCNTLPTIRAAPPSSPSLQPPSCRLCHHPRKPLPGNTAHPRLYSHSASYHLSIGSPMLWHKASRLRAPVCPSQNKSPRPRHSSRGAQCTNG